MPLIRLSAHKDNGYFQSRDFLIQIIFVDFQDQLAVVVEKNYRDVLGDMRTEKAAVWDRQLETDLYLGIVFR